MSRVQSSPVFSPVISYIHAVNLDFTKWHVVAWLIEFLWGTAVYAVLPEFSKRGLDTRLSVTMQYDKTLKFLCSLF